MIHIFLLLSYTHLEFNQNSYSFLKKRTQLEYGFNKGAQYKFIFLNVKSHMVFGLATQEEMQKIDLTGDLPFYCSGSYQLSNIQYFIKNDTEIKGTILEKSILTPYFYLCHTEINVSVDLEYDNGADHLDFRFQNFPLFIFIYTILAVLYIICFLIFCLCLPKKYPRNSNNYFLFGLLLTFLIQDIDALLLMNMEKHREYVQNIFFDAYEHNIKYKYDLISLFSIEISLFFILFYCYRTYLNDKKCTTSTCCKKSLLVIPIFCIIGNLPLMIAFHTNNDLLFPLFAGVFMLIYILCFALMRPYFTFVKLGLALYLLDALICSPVAYIVMHTVYDQSPVVSPIFSFMVIFFTLQTLSMIFLVFAFYNKNKFVAGDDNPILYKLSSYTIDCEENKNDDHQKDEQQNQDYNKSYC